MAANPSGLGVVKPPADQAARDAFIEQTEMNFSVIAAAGSGKTRAITDRIVSIARRPDAAEILPKLVVVTFTNRAADEMQQRARERILAANFGGDVLSAFDRAFFGTIHSFCVDLLARYGHFIGVPRSLDLIVSGDDDELWEEFVQRQTRIAEVLSESQRAALFRHMPLRPLMTLARCAPPPVASELGECPAVDVAPVLQYRAKANDTRILNAQRAAGEFAEDFAAGAEFVPVPGCDTASEKFLGPWLAAFGPLRSWLSRAALRVAGDLASRYRAYRLEHGAFTYDDQIALADELLQHPIAADAIRGENLRVILDEAQDTDARQFSVLLEVARPRGARGRWPNELADPPRPGHFSMVGDLQQSIYGERADLPRYRKLHERLIESGAAREVKFASTFRMDQATIDFVNATVPELLNDAEGQVAFVELQPRPDVLDGQVLRIELKPHRDVEAIKVPPHRAAADEAEQLAAWLCDKDLADLRARSWREVAVLSPRKQWLQPLRHAFEERGIACEVHSERALNAESPAHAWLVALLVVMTQPYCAFEVVGVLREVFGVTDHALAEFAGGRAECFELGENNRRENAPEALALLRAVAREIQPMSLSNAVAHLIARTELRARVNALPRAEVGDVETELRRLQNEADNAEAEGMTLQEFTDSLRLKLDAARDLPRGERDAIQLLTCHLAKGSEWDAVLVPFLARGYYYAHDRYPRILRQPDDEASLFVALDKLDVTDEIKRAAERAEKQSAERLLYVTLTRARHTLVLVDDREIFKRVPETTRDSQINTFSPKESANHEKLGALSDTPARCKATQRQHRAAAAERAAGSMDPLATLSRDEIDHAREHAADFIAQETPSAFARSRDRDAHEADAPLEHDGVARAGSAAIAYGTAWHAFVEALPLLGSDAAREEAARAFEPLFADRARFAREWSLLRTHLASADSFARRNASLLSIPHTEFPLSWRVHDQLVIEGSIDLALFNGVDHWLLLDWKTDRVDDLTTLKAQYETQIAAYWRAMQALTGMQVDAGLYSTVHGKLALYSPDELERAWNEIAKETTPPA